MAATVLGIAASLRNARWSRGARRLIEELRTCETEDQLKQFLSQQAELHLQHFVDAGRAEGLSFDQIYKKLRGLKGEQGLSNSEVALAAALWSAQASGNKIDHISLSEYFPASDRARRQEELKERLAGADGILLSTPVYFGDRGSLAQALVNLIRDDPDLRAQMAAKVYAGIAVGAKRNGGQETTLIYQMLDMIEAGLMAVGNDSDTTSQYGGTGHAGDVGTMPKDNYGLWTSMGTGRRVAHVSQIVKCGLQAELGAPVRIQFWILQDKDGQAANFVQRLVARNQHRIEASIIDVAGRHVTRCIACDICPTNVSVDSEYRCIIQPGGKDAVGDLHGSFLGQDAIVPVYLSTQDRERLHSNYQQFIERTRYLRRGDYVLSDALIAPLVLKDVGVEENMHIRMVTSMVRHHTVVRKPMIAHYHQGQLLNGDQVLDEFSKFVQSAYILTAGRLRHFSDRQQSPATKYQPVGYVLSTEKDKEDEKLKLRRQMIDERHRQLAQDASERLSQSQYHVA